MAGQQKDVEFRIVPSDDGCWHWEIITRGPLAVQVRHALVDIDAEGLDLAASHTTELAEKWGRRVRNLVTH
jgi:hypothetical protein